MCQAYEAEYQSICRSEARAATAGFIAAYRGEPESANPHHPVMRYEYEAWQHGWRCLTARILPWSVETAIRYRNPDDPDWGDTSQDEFRKTGVLPEKVRNVLHLEVAMFPS